MHRALGVAWLVACTGDDANTDSGGPGTPDGYPPTWAGVDQLFSDHCDRCHPAQQDKDLHTLIPDDITSGTEIYVVPGDPDQSFLWLTVSGGTPFKMPLDGLLPLETVDPIRESIADGAPLE